MAETITIARPYAQAVFDIAADAKALGRWSDALQLLTLIVSDPAMNALIRNPRVPREQQGEIVIDICGDALDENARNFVGVLAANQRLALLPEIAALYEAYRADAEKIVQADVASAFPLSDEQRKQIVASLKRRLGREVTLECRIDESLIGGAVIRAGDLVIDGSVTGQMDRLANALSR
jgi:F-type H+-transporting ATPase subunit delta